ncbi:hypothetical protein CUC53_06250 [Aeromonas cavernicola]|uniref:N-acetylmuramidase domain-containing protein n=2 Tax=Aeromonas cavernicola TaxID=1006623 RepID=A0A2H9U6E9_9GAMM|nr:hypothetical protein CUC53_06250 [Aeromonas cavernicola]
MHLACDEHYSGEGAARWVVKGDGNSSTYLPVVTSGTPAQLTRRVDEKNRPIYAKKGAEVILSTASPSDYRNHNNEMHACYLVSYADTPSEYFYIAASRLTQVRPSKPDWMTPPEDKPARHVILRNTIVRLHADLTDNGVGLAAGSEIEAPVLSVKIIAGQGGVIPMCQVRVYLAGQGQVKNSQAQPMTQASKGTIGWIKLSDLGQAIASVNYPATELDKVVDLRQSPIKVTAGELIGHWGEHETAEPASTTSGFALNSDKKALHLEVLVASKDKAALQACINNEGRLTGGQGYLVLKAGKSVTRYRLSKQNNQASYHDIGTYGPQPLPRAVTEREVIGHGANNFVKVAERAAASSDELAGEYVLLGGDVELVSQHDWCKLGVRLIDGSSDPDGFLDKADTDGKEGGEFFSELYGQVTADSDSDGTVSSSEIRAALADENVASQIRKLFICHESEWIKRPSWPRLAQELTEKPNLYQYALTVNRNMNWIDDSAIQGILGDSKPWFIHPAGMMGLVGDEIRNKKPKTYISGVLEAIEFLDFYSGDKIDDSDYLNAANLLACEVNAIKAVAITETGNAGSYYKFSDDDDHVPSILFERHKFSLHTGGIYDESYPEISNPNRGGYGAYKDQYRKLILAYSLNKDAALKSASWGKFQILGSNHRASGYSDVHSFVKSLSFSEKEHLKSFVNFIKADSKLLSAIRNKDWLKFALIYNGPKQVDYDVRMGENYDALQ